MKVGIFGAGSVGCFIGGMLAASANTVTMVGRSSMAENLKNGLLLTRYDGMQRKIESGTFEFSEDAARLSDCDCILVCVKSAATQEAGETLDTVLRGTGAGATILSFQNGVSNAGTLRKLLPGHEIGAAVVGFNIARLDGNRFHCGAEGKIVVEEIGAAGELVEALNEAAMDAETATDMHPILWGKLLLNLNNAVNALSGLPLKRELSQRDYRRVFSASIRETLAVLDAAGVTPSKVGTLPPSLLPVVLETPDWLFRIMAAGMLKIDESARSSMAEDLEHGRTPEIDWLNGETVRLGKEVGIATPVNSRVVELVKQVFAAGNQSGISGPQLRRQIGV